MVVGQDRGFDQRLFPYGVNPDVAFTVLAASALSGTTAEAPVTAVCHIRYPLRHGPSIPLTLR